jgi:hypothetical protein
MRHGREIVYRKRAFDGAQQFQVAAVAEQGSHADVRESGQRRLCPLAGIGAPHRSGQD